MEIIKLTADHSPEYRAWPAWATNPATGEGAAFDSEAEVPEGWEHHGKIKGGKAKAEPAKVLETVVAPEVAETVNEDAPKVDSAGTPFDPELHSGTFVKSSGLWRMKPGKARPAPLDL